MQWPLRARFGTVPKQTDLALDDLCRAVDRTRERLDAVLARADVLRAERAKGRRYAEIVAAEDRPLLVEVLSQVLDELAASGAAFRRAEARALHADGLSHEAIAEVFGVTRQRVSALLKETPRAG